MSAIRSAPALGRQKRRVRPRLYPQGVVYFIQEGAHGPIKIGTTTISPGERLRTMQTGNPRELRLLGFVPGGVEKERWYHGEFRRIRIGESEWFENDYRLRRFIRFVTSAAERREAEESRLELDRAFARMAL